MILGLDIGGANLKASDGELHSRSLPFELWKAPQELPAALNALLAPWPDWSALAMTMTAELADCFSTKAGGVDYLLQAVEEIAAGRSVSVWQTAGEFVSPEEAREEPSLVAAANWHALASWAGRMTPAGTAMLIDFGSTTCDIIPIDRGVPVPRGWTDLGRLQSGELLYLGCRRTPLCAIAGEVPFREGVVPLAAEWFATMLDVCLLTDVLPSDPNSHETADGRPATIECAHSRLAHMLCCDATEIGLREAQEIAQRLLDCVEQKLALAITTIVERFDAPCRSLLLSGEGERLLRRVIARLPGLRDSEVLSLAESLGPAHSNAACAFALARLARERLN